MLKGESPLKANSAVLIPTYHDAGEDYVLFTERAEYLPSHAGDISFPGGKCEPGDGSLLETALREAMEEIGLEPDDVDVYRELEPTETKTSGYTIQPFAGEIPADYTFTMNDEVTGIIRAPISELCRNYRTEYDEARERERIEFSYDDAVIWGVTARILSGFLEEEYDWASEEAER